MNTADARQYTELWVERGEAIALYSTPIVRNLARAVMRRRERLDRRLYFWQIGQFISDDAVRRQLLPEFYQRFRAARPAFWRLNDDLLGTVLSRRKQRAAAAGFPRPVRIVFGAADPYLNSTVARKFHALFPGSELFLLPDARHYVQIDAPERVAELILTAP